MRNIEFRFHQYDEPHNSKPQSVNYEFEYSQNMTVEEIKKHFTNFLANFVEDESI